MEANLSGTWAGELAGTNTGTFVLTVVDDAARIYGTARFHEPVVGSYEYDVQGVRKGEEYTIFLTPHRGQGLNLGTIGARCRLNQAGDLSGTWDTSVKTSGVFTARRLAPAQQENQSLNSAVFLVHGHDEATKEKVARFIEKLGIDVIILHEKVNQGMTVIEKFEEYAAQAKFAVILATPDDIGFPLGAEDRKQPRARQNVVLEMGYFIGKIGRDRVSVLYKGGVELPSDILGVVYQPIDDAGGWKLALAGELRRAGYSVDLNRIVA